MTTPIVPVISRRRERVAPISRRRILVWIAYLGLALGLVYAGVTIAGGVSDATDKIRHLNPWWIVPGIACVAVRFLLLGLQLRLLRGTSATPELRLGTGIASIAFGLGAVMPAAPAEGFALSNVELSRRGMSTRGAWLMLAASQWMQFWALVVVFSVDRIAAAAAGEVRRRQPTRIAISSLILLAVVTGAFWIVRRPGFGRRISGLGRFLPNERRKSRSQRETDGDALHADIQTTLGSSRRRLAVIVVSASCIVADAAVLWSVLHSVGANVAFEIAVIAYVAATVIAWVPFIPNGLGLTEIAIPALLHHFHVPLATGLAAILLWRVVAQGVPALAGLTAWLFYKRSARPRNSPPAASASPPALPVETAP